MSGTAGPKLDVLIEETNKVDNADKIEDLSPLSSSGGSKEDTW